VNEPYDLERFVTAQNTGRTFERALAELRNGHKQSHWMWYVFPQISGLGHSPTSKAFAISSLEEAKAYLRHPVLGARLVECTRVVAGTDGGSAEAIFGAIDALKLRSSMTLFMRAASDEPLFGQVLDRYFGGSPDPATDHLL
jgi:uncharacterized protein (DUF1810 family)